MTSPRPAPPARETPAPHVPSPFCAASVSDGGVHAHQDHAVALARALVSAGIRVMVHACMDGRDTSPRSGADSIAWLTRALPQGAAVATVCGRSYAMDRDNRWDRVARAYAAVVDARGYSYADAASAVDAAYLRCPSITNRAKRNEPSDPAISQKDCRS